MTFLCPSFFTELSFETLTILLMSHKEKKASAETHARHESENIQNDFW